MTRDENVGDYLIAALKVRTLERERNGRTVNKTIVTIVKEHIVCMKLLDTQV